MIKILHLEDDPNDAKLIQMKLAAEGLEAEIERVETRDAFLAGLARGGFDLILSDNKLPTFDGLSALALARERRPEIPFLFCSGTLGEEVAIEAMQHGATDYVIKDRMQRLVPAVRRALREAEECRKRVQAEAELRRTEEHLRQAQKLEAIGQLTGGIAHDFNNLLMIINGYSEMTLKALKADDALRPNIEQIKEAGERASVLTRQLLAFSRKQMLEPKVLDLNGIATNLEKMLHRMIGEDVRLETTLSSALGRVKADPGQIEQVLMNLAVNARDAMPRGGTLTIETANVELDDDFVSRHVGARPGPHVRLAVRDTGCGMDAETQTRIFEPFFTTKETGKGTGLGLSTVYGIVKQSEGSIWVDSDIGRGTTFNIYLPLVTEAPDQAAPSHARADVLTGTETILLVEDEAGVRGLIRRILEAHGYAVLEASGGAEALRICEQRKCGAHLLLTDVVMPEMSGRELAARVAALCPALKVLYISGYTDDAIVRHGVSSEGGAPFLQKPFTTHGLLLKVREVLDA